VKSRYAWKTAILLFQRIVPTGLIFLINVQAQSVYEIQPGTKGNQIKLTIANVSEINTIENVNIQLPQSFERMKDYLTFSKESQTIERLNPGEETEVVFEFDIKRNSPVNKKDTLEFSITDGRTIFAKKHIILNYIGPKDYKLEQNFPNPFNPSTTIQYELPKDSKVTLKIYDILGSEVVTLVNEEQEAGYKEVNFNASYYASGIYIYRLIVDKYISTKKMMLIK
jgi:hypothetical protein